MNEHTLPHLHRQMNLIYKSLGMPTIEESLADIGSVPSIDERNEELYDRDDQRQFHVPITLVRNTFASVMAKSAEEAEVIVQERLREKVSSDAQPITLSAKKTAKKTVTGTNGRAAATVANGAATKHQILSGEGSVSACKSNRPAKKERQKAR